MRKNASYEKRYWEFIVSKNLIDDYFLWSKENGF